MPNKIPAMISVIVTILLLIIFGVVSALFELIALNGASESQGTTALIFSLVCQGAAIILVGIFVSWLTDRLISKFNWNKIIAVVVAVTAGTLLGGGISFLSIILSIPMAGIK